MMMQKDAWDPQTVSIARKPIFDNRGYLWGYELVCISNGQPLQSETAINVASSAYLCLQQIMQGGKKIIVDFSEKSILDNLPYVLPPVRAAIKIGEELGKQPEAMETLVNLKSHGYLIAIRDFTGDPACKSLYALADILAIKTGIENTAEMMAGLASAQPYKAQLLASHVQDRKLYDDCREQGFSLFSGPFFKYPDTMTVRKLSSNEILRFKLLKLIESKDPDIPQIVKTIQSDATISFRLLAFLNSAAFVFSQKIKSIQQAISLLGWSNTKNWLRVVLLTDMTQTKEAQELVLLSAQRGMFLELIAREHNYWGFDPETMHLLGLFSLLDALLALPMTEIASHLPIDNKMKTALCREANNEYSPLLHLAFCFEEAQWGEVETEIRRLNLDSAKVMPAFQKSVDWASQLTQLLT
jgi:EAL and modified HD-GYP domain-containing signal transduction protein